MINKKSEILTKKGWAILGDSEAAHFNIDDRTIYWDSIFIEDESVQKVHQLSASLWGGVSTTMDHTLVVTDYHRSYSNNKVTVNTVNGLSSGDCLINRFHTFKDHPSPMLAFNHSCTKYFDDEDDIKKKELMVALNDIEVPYIEDALEIKVDTAMPYNLVEHICFTSRYQDLLYWHGRTNIKSRAHGLLQDRALFSNYCPRALDNIQLSALGCNKSPVMKDNEVLVYNKTPPLKITRKETFDAPCVSLVGNGFILTRTNGLVGVVGVN